MIRFTILLFIITILVSCGGIETETITLNNAKTESYVNLSDEVWIVKPNGFVRAKSYEGYQNDPFNVQASISYEKRWVKLQQVKNSFDENYLKTKRTSLLESREVVFENTELENGYFSKVSDKRKGTVRYLLAIPKDGVVHHIKGFCLQSLENKYDKRLKTYIFSTVFAEKIEKEEPYKIANTDDFGKVTLTRDGTMDPKDEHHDMIEVYTIEGEKYIVDVEVKDYIKNLFKERIGTDKVMVHNMLDDYIASFETEEKSMVVWAVPEKTGKKTIVIGTSNSNSIPEDMNFTIRHKLFKTVIAKNQ